MQVADDTPCYFHVAGGGICASGNCVDNSQIVHFEDFGPAENNQRFGVELPAVYEGFEWAYADPLKIADSTCTTATATTCWGSWAVSDSSGDGVSGATGENWLRARSADQGKGAKITKSSGFVTPARRNLPSDRSDSAGGGIRTV